MSSFSKYIPKDSKIKGQVCNLTSNCLGKQQLQILVKHIKAFKYIPLFDLSNSPVRKACPCVL